MCGLVGPPVELSIGPAFAFKDEGFFVGPVDGRASQEGACVHDALSRSGEHWPVDESSVSSISSVSFRVTGTGIIEISRIGFCARFIFVAYLSAIC